MAVCDFLSLHGGSTAKKVTQCRTIPQATQDNMDSSPTLLAI